MTDQKKPYILRFSETGIKDVGIVGGKNASLGEMIRNLHSKGVQVPDGFATTADAYRLFLDENGLQVKISAVLEEYHKGSNDLETTGEQIRSMMIKAELPAVLKDQICREYDALSRQYHKLSNGQTAISPVDVAVRSSATAEDLPHASFAGQQETYLNVQGADELLDICKKCFASLFTNRAISYREKMGFDHMSVALSIGVQKMVRADRTASGVMFTVDTESGFPNVVMINGSWGLGENVVQGTVTPDQFYVFKPHLNHPTFKPVLEKVLGSKEMKMIRSRNGSGRIENIPTSPDERGRFVLNDEEVLKLARWGVVIEDHYDRPMDIEWVKDEESGELFIVQARPETIHSNREGGIFKTYKLIDSPTEPLVEGLSVGGAITTGTVKIVRDATDLTGINQQTILVTEMTEPDWVPALKNAAGIITDQGGRTCHAAIVSRELGIPAVVGTGNAMSRLKDGMNITLSCAEGDVGRIYEGVLEFETEEIDLDTLPETNLNVMLNLATPESAFKWWKLPVKGVGLARMEFIITNHIKIHPMALVKPDRVDDEAERDQIRKLTAGYEDMKDYFVDRLASGIAKIAASQYPSPVIVRTSDFKTNEYAGLIGGRSFEPKEENPMLGWRGAARYYDEKYRDGFALECRALKKVREEIGLDNVIVMIPFCRTLTEAESVLDVMSGYGLERGENGLQVYMMCEIPANYILAERFAAFFDGFSIGSNDLTQLILGVDRDSGAMAHLFDENDPAVRTVIREVISRAHKAGIKVGFCGQAPSNNADYAKFLVECGIDTISVVPDSVVDVVTKVAQAEQEQIRIVS
jgi:pyruvate, water dikinase